MSLIFLNLTYLDQGMSNERHYDTNKKPIGCTLLLHATEGNTLQLKEEECKEPTQTKPFACVSQRKTVLTANPLSTFRMI